MLIYIVLTALLALIAVLNFVNTAKLAQSKNWSPVKTRFYFACDSLFAIFTAAAIVAVWVLKEV
jgi:ABC-type arginine transport system permease subunit